MKKTADMLNVNYNTTFPRTSARNLGYVNLSGLLPFTRVLFRTWLNLETFSVPFVAQLANIYVRRKICVLEAIMFLIRYKNVFLFPRGKTCFPKICFAARRNWETLACEQALGVQGVGDRKEPRPHPLELALILGKHLLWQQCFPV